MVLMVFVIFDNVEFNEALFLGKSCKESVSECVNDSMQIMSGFISIMQCRLFKKFTNRY